MARIKPDIIDVRSSFDEAAASVYEQESLKDWYEDVLLSAARQSASQASSLYYGQKQQEAAEIASYDISNAYANYLKQQRNVMGASNLMAGHKEELSSALKSSFEASAQQARAVEAQSLATAAGEASDIYSDVYKTESTAAKSLYDTLMADVQKKTDLYKAVESRLFDEEYVKSLGINTGYTTEAGDEVKFNIYETKGGKLEFTDYGKDVLSKALLTDPFAFEQYLESEGETELLEYYKNNPVALREELFGLKEESYGLTEESRELSKQRLFGTEGYIESIAVPTHSVTGHRWDKLADDTQKSVETYAQSIGLTTQDIVEALDGKTINEYLIAAEKEAENQWVKGIGAKAARETAQTAYTELLTILKDKASKKYIHKT